MAKNTPALASDETRIKWLTRQLAIARQQNLKFKKQLLARAADVDELRARLEQLRAAGLAVVAAPNELSWATFQLELEKAARRPAAEGGAR
jgi:hypothetical protein